MVKKLRLRTTLGILNTAFLITDSRAFLSRTSQTKTPARIREPQQNYDHSIQRPFLSPLFSTVTTDESNEALQQSSPAPAATTDAKPSNNSSPIPTEWVGEVLNTLKAVIDPDLGQDIVTLGFVQNIELDETLRKISFDVELTTPACPVKETFRTDCQSLVMGLPFVDAVEVTMTAQAPASDTDTSGMAGIGAVIAVSSCKGGVGKSTTSVNLAYSLQAMGASVGIFDADIYGPSLPTMVTPDDDIVRFVGRQIAPLQRNGVKLMSFGYINDGSAVMRGPMVTQLLDQFLSVTQWGSLDYLILDMPPGTGDIQLTLTQKLNITAAVIVTTPQELSFADVVRGVEMFDTVNVPCIAVVENMAYYNSEPAKTVNNADELQENVRAMLAEKGLATNGEGKEIAEELVQMVLKNAKTKPVRIFGPGHKKRLSSQWGIEHTYSMPLMEKIAANGDSGIPYVLGNPDTAQTQIYKELATAVVSEVARCKYNTRRPEIEYIEEFHILQVDEEPLGPAELRRACRCAACVEEMTGRQILNPADIRDDIYPLRMSSTGNYALSVDWSDGHKSLYPYRQILDLVYDDDDDDDDDVEPHPVLSVPSKEEKQQQPKVSPFAKVESSFSKTEDNEDETSTAPTISPVTNTTEEKSCSCCP